MPFDRLPTPPQERQPEHPLQRIQRYFTTPKEFVTLHTAVPEWMVHMIASLEVVEDTPEARAHRLEVVNHADAMIRKAFTHIQNPPQARIRAFEDAFRQARDLLSDPWQAHALSAQLKQEAAFSAVSDDPFAMGEAEPADPIEEALLPVLERMYARDIPSSSNTDSAKVAFIEGEKLPSPRVPEIVPSYRALPWRPAFGVRGEVQAPVRPAASHRDDGDDL